MWKINKVNTPQGRAYFYFSFYFKKVENEKLVRIGAANVTDFIRTSAGQEMFSFRQERWSRKKALEIKISPI